MRNVESSAWPVQHEHQDGPGQEPEAGGNQSHFGEHRSAGDTEEILTPCSARQKCSRQQACQPRGERDIVRQLPDVASEFLNSGVLDFVR